MIIGLILIAGCPAQILETREAVIVGSSMGPHLLGSHVEADCSSCGCTFVAGFLDAEPQRTFRQYQQASLICPNCGTESQNHALADRSRQSVTIHLDAKPRRWSVVAFRGDESATNSKSPVDASGASQPAGVKRVVGLPGEQLEIHEGNLYVADEDNPRPASISKDRSPHRKPIDANNESSHESRNRLTNVSNRNSRPRIAGKMLRKPLQVQREVALLVHDSAFESSQDPWVESTLPSTWDETHSLVRPGVLPSDVREKKASQADASQLQVAKSESLVALTFHPLQSFRVGGEGALSQRPAGIVDYYGCNQFLARDLHAMDELLVSLDFAENKLEPFLIQFNLRGRIYSVQLNLKAGEVGLVDSEGGRKSVWNRKWPQAVPRRTSDPVSDPPLLAGRQASRPSMLNVEVSSVDHQIAVAVNGKTIFVEAIEPGVGDVSPLPIRLVLPTRCASQLSRKRLFRDLHYLNAPLPVNSQGRREVPVFSSGEGYLLLGDNVPVSFDSRHWPQPAISRDRILGVVQSP